MVAVRGWGLLTVRSSGQVLSFNFYGMQKEFFVLFCFFVKLKKKSTSYT